jgi:uncharacterized protein YPO0396
MVMSRRIGAIVIAVIIVGSASLAWADCSDTIAQAKAALEEVKRTPGIAAVKDAKIAAAQTNIASAEAACSAGQDEEATRQAKEALRALGK